MQGLELVIHWHGLHQRNTQYSDGVPYVTQCPIHEGNTFRYQFDANSGTHFWHAHSGKRRVEGEKRAQCCCCLSRDRSVINTLSVYPAIKMSVIHPISLSLSYELFYFDLPHLAYLENPRLYRLYHIFNLLPLIYGHNHYCTLCAQNAAVVVFYTAIALNLVSRIYYRFTFLTLPCTFFFFFLHVIRRAL